MLKEDIVVGRSYVNNEDSVIREVVEETDAHHVKFNQFELATGKLVPAPNRISHRRQFARWAHREATAVEAARTHPYRAGALLDSEVLVLRGGSPLDRVKTSLSGATAQLIFPRAK